MKCLLVWCLHSFLSLPLIPQPCSQRVHSYTCLYLNRGTLTYSAPVMVNDISLGLSKTDIGAMTSAFPAAYGALALRTHLRCLHAVRLCGGLQGLNCRPTTMIVRVFSTPF